MWRDIKISIYLSIYHVLPHSTTGTELFRQGSFTLYSDSASHRFLGWMLPTTPKTKDSSEKLQGI